MAMLNNQMVMISRLFVVVKCIFLVVHPDFSGVNHGEPSSVKSQPQASQDRDYSGCPCRSWNGIVEYRCEAWGAFPASRNHGWFSLGLRIESLKESYLKEIDQQVGNTYFI